jgi:putative serine protease PepD
VSTRGTALSASDIYKQDSPGVVAIKASSPLQQDSGTGIVLSRDGLIVTNDHVISGATSLSVTVGSSTTSRTAQVVGESPNTDLAVIKIDASGLTLHPLTLAQSSTVGVGDPVYAIGNPYGLDQTLTRGIVSALSRQISAPSGATINGAIQTDAALNPGNSGGPLIDARGEVIGINSQIASAQTSASGQAGSTGVGFAIASDTVKTVVAQLERTHAGAIQSPQQTQQLQVPGGADPYGQSTGPYGGGGADGQPYVIVPGGGGQVAIGP